MEGAMKIKRFLKRSIFFIFAISVLSATMARGATFCVSDEAELQSALTTAAGNGEDDAIQIVQGTYEGNFVYASLEARNLTVKGGYTADCSTREVDPANTILDGMGLDTVLALASEDKANFSVEGLTLQNGSAGTALHGGGLYAKTQGDVNLDSNSFTGNRAESSGGGAYVDTGSYGHVTLTDNAFTENRCDANGGGAYVDAGSYGDVTLTNNTLTENSAENSGGGAYVYGDYYGDVTLTNNTLTRNTADSSGGGAYVRGSHGDVILINNTLTGNSAENSGGGAYVYGDDSDVTLTSNTFAGNTADRYHGGGAYVYGNSGNVTLINNTLTGNSAEEDGGGAYLTLNNNNYTCVVYNNIIWNNDASEGADLYVVNRGSNPFIPVPVKLFNNDLDQSANGTYIAVPFTIDSSNLNNIDPLFVGSGDLHLTAESSCINTGSNDAQDLPNTDRDGNPRIVDEAVDMGAYEYQGTVAPTANFTAHPMSGPVPLTVNFTDQSTGSITSWEWAFGDDNATSTEQNPSHIYNDPGTYTVALTVTGPGGSDTETKIDYITVYAAVGSLTVILKPQNAIDAGARWQVDGGAWQDSGATVSGLTVGQHSLRFKDIDGWIPPRMKTVTVVPGQIPEILAVYSQETGRLPDGGQTQSYTGTFGEDSDYLINPPSFTKLDGNGNDLPDSVISWVMIRDNVTGLIWEVKTDDGSIHDKDNTYTWYDSNPETNGGDPGTPGDGTDTEDFINALNAANFGGFSDWRLPTIKELASVVNLGRSDPAIDTNYFPKTLSSSYWSSTTYVGASSNAWEMKFYSGRKYPYSKPNRYFVRAVRGGQTVSLDHLVINGEGTVTDTSTGLMWQHTTASIMTWETAFSYCEGLSLAGYDGWRLPNRTELRSIVEYEKSNPAIDADIFPDTVSSSYWSSTTYAGNSSTAWHMYFLYGSSSNGCKSSSYYYVRAVRGGQNRISGHLVILIPAQGSRWDIGSSIPITWQPQDIPGNVEISISRQGGKEGSFETIAESTENDGIYDWPVTGPVSCNCVLKIEPLDDPTKATTQSLFTIASTIQPTATISGVPNSPTNQTDATLTVGGDSIISYKYKLDDGEYANETLVTNQIVLTDLTVGDHMVYVLGRDAAGDWQIEATTATWTVRTQAPTAIISGTPSNPTNHTSASLTIGGEGVTHYKYKLDDGAYGSETSVADPIILAGLTDGNHTVYVIGRDEAGNWQSETNPTTASWSVDTAAPTITGLSDDLVPTQSKTWTWDADETATFRFAINQDETWTPSGEFGITKTATKSGADGIWYLHVQAKDTAGNASQVTVYATLDNTPPACTITGLPSSPTHQTGVTLTVEGIGVTHYRYKLDDGTYSGEMEVHIPMTLSGLSDGTHTIYVLGRDLAGNWQAEPTTASLTVDTEAPVITGLSDDPTPTQSKTWTWDADETAVFRYSIDQNQTWAPSGNFSDTKTATMSGVHGTWYIHVQAKDLAGNESSVTTVSAALINQPIATTESAGPVSATSATLNGMVNANGESTMVTFEYGTDTNYGNTVSATQGQITGTTDQAVSADLNALTLETVYHFRVRATNSAGTTYGDDKTFSTGPLEAAINIGSVSGRKGGEVSVPITITNMAGTNISAISLDIDYDSQIFNYAKAVIGPAGEAAGKRLETNSISPGLFRVSVFSALNNAPIGSGVVAYLILEINEEAPLGTTELLNTPSASDSDGYVVLVSGANGSVNVTDYDAGDCNGDEMVSIAEVQSAINMFIEINPIEECVDVNANGRVSIGELQKVVNNHLDIGRIMAVEVLYMESQTERRAFGAQMVESEVILSSLDIGEATGVPGETVTVPLIFTNESLDDISALSTDLIYDPNILSNPSVDMNPSGTNPNNEVLFNEVSSGVFRVSVISIADNNIIEDGMVAYVTFEINPDASWEDAVLENYPSASDPSGYEMDIDGRNGIIEISALDQTVHPTPIAW